MGAHMSINANIPKFFNGQYFNHSPIPFSPSPFFSTHLWHLHSGKPNLHMRIANKIPVIVTFLFSWEIAVWTRLLPLGRFVHFWKFFVCMFFHQEGSVLWQIAWKLISKLTRNILVGCHLVKNVEKVTKKVLDFH